MGTGLLLNRKINKNGGGLLQEVPIRYLFLFTQEKSTRTNARRHKKSHVIAPGPAESNGILAPELCVTICPAKGVDAEEWPCASRGFSRVARG